MDTALTTDIATLFDKTPFDQASFATLKEAAFDNPESLNRFLELLAGFESNAVKSGGGDAAAAYKLGACYLALGEHEKATTWLTKADSVGDAHFFLGHVRRDQRKYAEAIAEYEKAARQGGDKIDCDLHRAECMILSGQFDGAKKILGEHSSSEKTSATYHYVQGRLAEEQGSLEAAMAKYESAIELDHSHAQSMFRLAYLLDLHGSDDRALELYLQCSELPYVATNALINLAVIFEDEGEHDKAASCLRRVLTVSPNHPRAMLYFKDVLASLHMYIDETQIRAKEEHDAVLDVPVTDFELSVRSRNCLKKMNIHTLGDLLRITEQELLAYKNFGETSLREIKAMLAQKGLSLGMNSPEKMSAMRSSLAAMAAPAPLPPSTIVVEGDTEVLARSVSTMELSVRSRKCLQRLGINTIGELLSRSEAELLESRNFGLTSLKEIKEGLLTMGLSLRP